jgi:uncharacterized protein
VTEAERSRTIASIVMYLLLTFALSSFFYWKLTHPTPGMRQGQFYLGLMWCPGVSGLLTRLLFQHNWRGHGFRWGKTKYQFASYWIPLVYACAVYLPVWFAGYFDPRSTMLAGLERRVPAIGPGGALLAFFVLIATLGVLSSCLSAVGEELGWRGFLVPQLAKVTSFPKVALLSGIIWASWHIPVILGGDYHGAGPAWYSVTCFVVMVVGISFVFAWMRLKSGSMWTGMLLHASHNCFIQAFFDPQTRHARFTDLWTTEFGAGLALAGIVLAVIFYGKRREVPEALLAG